MEANQPHPDRHTADLHRGRWSASGLRYFITCCLQRPATGLTSPLCAAAIRSAWQTLTADGDIVLECATIMPDHLHALLVLGQRLQLGRVVAKFKALTRTALLANGVAWQRDFFEHQLRPDEHASPFARYIFLNPYRAGLLERRASWTHTYLKPEHDFDFLAMLEEGLYPPAEWLALPADKLGLDLKIIGND